MKKILAFLLCAALLAGVLSACGGSPADNGNTDAEPKTENTPANNAPDKTPENSETPADKPAETPTDTPADTPTETPAETEDGAFSAEGSVIYDDNGLKVTTVSLDVDPYTMDPAPLIWVDVENSNDEDAYLGVADGSVNGVVSDVVIVELYEEGGEYIGASYNFSVVVPAKSTTRYGLSYYKHGIEGIDEDTLAELEFCFTLAEDEYSWPDYQSGPITIVTGETAAPVDIASLGTVVADNENLTVVIGDQDYTDFLGPVVNVYVLNKTDKYLGINGETCTADGVFSDYIYYSRTLTPGKLAADTMSFEGDVRELKGFEKLSVIFAYRLSDTSDGLYNMDSEALEGATVTYPAQNFGVYENAGMTLEIKPRINDLVIVNTPDNAADGTIFEVYEKKSAEIGKYEGAGWLGSIARVSAERVHELLCYDMSGVDVFARDYEGNYYLYLHPTDVRFERATTEEMFADAEEWSMLCAWIDTVPDKLCDDHDLESYSFGNTEVDMYIARAAWEKGVNATLSTVEYGPVDASAADGTAYAEAMLRAWYWETDLDETPDGEYVVLNFPDENVRIDFFIADGTYVRVVTEYKTSLYVCSWYNDDISYSDIMRGWYYEAAEAAGVKAADHSLDAYLGDWYEVIAGRAMVMIRKSFVPGKVDVSARWPVSYGEAAYWNMVATLTEDGRLAYENGEYSVLEFDDDGDSWEKDGDWPIAGELWLNGGELCWKDDYADGTFTR